MTTISNNRRKKIRVSTVASICIIIFVLFGVFMFRDPLASLLWRGLTPIFEAKNGTTAAAGFLSGFSSNVELARANAALKAELASSTIRLMDRDLLLKENAELKVRLGRDAEPAPLLAAVLLTPPGTPYDTIMIDVGTKRGVKAGDLVAAGGNVYIGKVAAAYETASRVILFSSPGQTYQALLKGSIPLSLEGQGGGSIVGELPAGTDVHQGDQVILPSIAPQYIAQVVQVVSKEGESFQSIYLELPVNPYSLRFVEVHTHSNENE